MKKRTLKTNMQKAVALTLALTLTVPTVAPAFTVEAQEAEVQEM